MTNLQSARIKRLVSVSKKYKIDSPQSSGVGWGVPFPQKIESVHKANANLMDFAFSFFGNKEKFFWKYSEGMEVLQ